MDDPIQRQAWEILQEIKPGIRNKVVCNAIVKQDFEESLRKLIQEELQKVSFVQQNDEQSESEDATNDEFLDFILALQNSADPWSNDTIGRCQLAPATQKI